MAQVTVDYEEFAALKKREADYEKMVEDLKKENQELKDTHKVIIRQRQVKKDENGRIPIDTIGSITSLTPMSILKMLRTM